MFRSQMAEAIYNHITNSRDASSAGTYTGTLNEPEGQILSNVLSPYLLNLMESHGMDIRSNHTKKLLPEMLDNADIVVSMTEEPFIPDFLKNNKKVILWDIKNPENATPNFIKKTYDKLDTLVKELIEPRKTID